MYGNVFTIFFLLLSHGSDNLSDGGEHMPMSALKEIMDGWIDRYIVAVKCAWPDRDKKYPRARTLEGGWARHATLL